MNKKIVFTKKLKLFILVLLYNLSSNIVLTNRHHNQDISLWIDEKQISQFSGFKRSVFAIIEGDVLPYVLDPNFEKYLPIIPAEVHSVNFTWRSGYDKIYYYDFDRLISFDKKILLDPVINIERAGKIPLYGSQFEVKLLCLKNITGVGSLEIGLSIKNEQNKLLPGTPLRLHLKKYCAQKEPDKNCYLNCINGVCNQDNICTCKKGYLGKYCENALCYPQCLNGGICIKPGFCSCPNGFQGPHCEGGICTERCQNGGRCMQKDTCECTRGYFGPRCSFSKCLIPCLNNGRCIGVNKCKCRKGYFGSQCEIVDEVILSRSKIKRRERVKYV